MEQAMAIIQALMPVLAAAVPLFVAFIATVQWTSQQKATAAVVASGVVGVLYAWVSGQFDLANIATSVAVALGIAQAAYALVFKPAGWTSVILENLGNTAPALPEAPAPAPADTVDLSDILGDPGE